MGTKVPALCCLRAKRAFTRRRMRLAGAADTAAGTTLGRRAPSPYLYAYRLLFGRRSLADSESGCTSAERCPAQPNPGRFKLRIRSSWARSFGRGGAMLCKVTDRLRINVILIGLAAGLSACGASARYPVSAGQGPDRKSV